jgi:hypothetical protein
MAVGGRHGAKAKISSPAGRARASAPLGPTQPVAPAACGPREPRGEPRKRRSPRAITRRAPRWLLLWLWPIHGAGGLGFQPQPNPDRAAPCGVALCRGQGRRPLKKGGVTLGGRGAFRRFGLGKRVVAGGGPLGPGLVARRRPEKILA